MMPVYDENVALQDHFQVFCDLETLASLQNVKNTCGGVLCEPKQ